MIELILSARLILIPLRLRLKNLQGLSEEAHRYLRWCDAESCDIQRLRTQYGVRIAISDGYRDVIKLDERFDDRLMKPTIISADSFFSGHTHHRHDSSIPRRTHFGNYST